MSKNEKRKKVFSQKYEKNYFTRIFYVYLENKNFSAPY